MIIENNDLPDFTIINFKMFGKEEDGQTYLIFWPRYNNLGSDINEKFTINEGFFCDGELIFDISWTRGGGWKHNDEELVPIEIPWDSPGNEEHVFTIVIDYKLDTSLEGYITGEEHGDIEELIETNNYMQRIFKYKTRSASPSGNDYPFLCLISKTALNIADKSWEYRNAGLEGLRRIYALIGVPILLFAYQLMESKGIENMTQLDCHCAWDRDDFPNIPDENWD